MGDGGNIEGVCKFSSIHALCSILALLCCLTPDVLVLMALTSASSEQTSTLMHVSAKQQWGC